MSPQGVRRQLTEESACSQIHSEFEKSPPLPWHCCVGLAAKLRAAMADAEGEEKHTEREGAAAACLMEANNAITQDEQRYKIGLELRERDVTVR